MISVKHLRRTFGPVVAVDDISFEVGKGEVLGFIGPNGAGKSTAMKMITCFLPPDRGSATVCGHDIVTDPVGARQILGYLPENAPAYGEMTVDSYLGFICDARGITGAGRRKAIDRMMDRCAIREVRHRTIENLSKGYKRRVGLAATLIHDPQVLILDEPTDGLDPNQKHEVRELLKEMAPEKCTIISTHILEEVEAICTRTIIIDQGKIVTDATPTALKEKYHANLDEIFRKVTVGKRT